MITEIDYKCKEYRRIVGPGKSTSAVRGWFSSAKCPMCGAVGQFRHHGYYDRDCLSFEDGEWNWHTIQIVRGSCKSCSHTHAFLPVDIIPYRCLLVRDFLAVIWVAFFDRGETHSNLSDLPSRESFSVYDTSARTISIRGYYNLLMLFRYFFNYILDLFRRLDLWDQAQQPSEAQAAKILLLSDLQKIQEKVLEIHRIPLFFRRKRSKDKFPYTGMYRCG